MSQTDACQLLRMCLLPQDASWQSPLPVADVNSLRLNSLSLRFYTNNSSLWRFRSLMVLSVQDSNDFQHELSFFKELSGFKAFNYHAYNYMLSLSTHPGYRANSELYLNTLVDQAIRDPSNFSPLHILITGYESNLFDPHLFFRAVSRLIDRTPSEALIEFSVSLCLLKDVPESILSRCRSLVPQDSPYRGIIV